MTRPDDIAEEAWEIGDLTAAQIFELVTSWKLGGMRDNQGFVTRAVTAIARAIMAAEQRGREKAAQRIEELEAALSLVAPLLVNQMGTDELQHVKDAVASAMTALSPDTQER